MRNTNTSSTNLTTAQAPNEPALRLHRDGRLSYKDTGGHWTRYVNEIPGELFSKVPGPQRRRLLQHKRAGLNGGKLVLVRVINKAAHRSECPLCKASTRRTVAKVASGAVVQYRECPHCNWHSIERPYIQRGLTQLEFAFMATGLNGHPNIKQ